LALTCPPGSTPFPYTTLFRSHRLVHRLARNDARRLDVHAAALGGGDRALAVDRLAQRVDDAAQEALADRHVHDLAQPADFVALRSEEHTSEIQSRENLVCRLL